MDIADETAWAAWRGRWTLRPGVTYLNHGSFGPPPREVLDERNRWLARLAENPMEFLVRKLGGYLAEAEARLGAFVGTAAENLLFVDNTTLGMNVVAASFLLAPGDEVLLNDHEYGAVLRIWQRACDRAGAKLVVQPLPVPMTTPEALIEAVLAGATERTKLLVFSHITSPTAIVFPAAELTRAARRRGLAVCIDGPHAPAQAKIDLDGIDCDYYTASCHKWLSAPFGSGFLYVHPRRQGAVTPPELSWGRPLEGRPADWRDEFQWQGTRDLSAYLSVPAAIDFLERVGADEFRARTHYLARYARARLEELTGLAALVPDGEAWYGSMIAMPLPAGEAEPLQAALWQRYGIEAPIVAWNGRRLVRVSCHLYTQREEIDRLVAALRELLGT